MAVTAAVAEVATLATEVVATAATGAAEVTVAETASKTHKQNTTHMNTFGKIFTITSFGESHGAGIGGVIDGMPAGIEVDMNFIQRE